MTGWQPRTHWEEYLGEPLVAGGADAVELLPHQAEDDDEVDEEGEEGQDELEDVGNLEEGEDGHDGEGAAVGVVLQYKGWWMVYSDGDDDGNGTNGDDYNGSDDDNDDDDDDDDDYDDDRDDDDVAATLGLSAMQGVMTMSRMELRVVMRPTKMKMR